jgi:hypothetical protein
MTTNSLVRKVGTAAAIAGLGAAATGTAAAPAESSHESAIISPSGVDGVKLGARYSTLRKHHKIGKIRKGCNLGGPNTRSARLLSPLKGSVDFTLTARRYVANITVTGGAESRGVGIGATIAQIKRAFPKAKSDHSTDKTFGVTLVKIPKGHGGRLQFAVSTKTEKTVEIGIPFIAFCE